MNTSTYPPATFGPRRSNGLRLHWLAALGLILSLATAPAWAALGPDRILGSSGEVIQVRSGFFGDLFPGETGVNPHHWVLALDLEYPGGSERLLVPTTETWRPDRHPTIAYDSRNDAVMLFWVSGSGEGTWTMEVTSYRDGEWQAVSKVQANGRTVFIGKLPKVVVTTDDFYLDLSDEAPPIETRRTTFHAVWHSGAAVHYSPVSFVDGFHVGWSETVSLTDLVFQSQQGQGGDPLPPGSIPANLSGALNLGTAIDPNAVTVTLTDEATGQIATLKVEETPMTLAHIASRVRDDVLSQGSHYQPEDLDALADYIRSDIIFIGQKCRLHPTVGRYLADEIAGWLRADGGGYGQDLDALGSEARRQTLDAGASIYAKTLGTPDFEDDMALELVALEEGAVHLDKLREQIRVTLPAAFEPPTVGQGQTTLFTSADNRSILVTWKAAESDVIHYTENLGAGWTEPLSLQLSDRLTEADAYELLQRKIR